MLMSDVLLQDIMSYCFPPTICLQKTDRATIHFYYKNPFNFLYQKEIES